MPKRADIERFVDLATDMVQKRGQAHGDNRWRLEINDIFVECQSYGNEGLSVCFGTQTILTTPALLARAMRSDRIWVQLANEASLRSQWDEYDRFQVDVEAGTIQPPLRHQLAAYIGRLSADEYMYGKIIKYDNLNTTPSAPVCDVEYSSDAFRPLPVILEQWTGFLTRFYN